MELLIALLCRAFLSHLPSKRCPCLASMIWWQWATFPPKFHSTDRKFSMAPVHSMNWIMHDLEKLTAQSYYLLSRPVSYWESGGAVPHQTIKGPHAENSHKTATSYACADLKIQCQRVITDSHAAWMCLRSHHWVLPRLQRSRRPTILLHWLDVRVNTRMQLLHNISGIFSSQNSHILTWLNIPGRYLCGKI